MIWLRMLVCCRTPPKRHLLEKSLRAPDADHVLRFIVPELFGPRLESLGQRCGLVEGRHCWRLDIEIGRKAFPVDLERALYADKPATDQISRLDAFKAEPHQSSA